MQIESLYEKYLAYPKVQTDTRRIAPGELFFALKGEHFNGNEFVGKALEAGAAYAVADEAPSFQDDRILLVDDVLTTLQELAHHHRRQFNIPVLAITGSNGKTTTKELVHSVLSTRYRTHTTRGNLNNHIGIPLTLLEMQHDAEIAVIEMGANHQREIAGYCRYVEPTHGLITNCGKAHLEGFGGVEGVRKGKGELYDFLRSHKGICFVMWDYDYLREMSRDIPGVITYGTSDADLTGHALQHEPFLNVGIDGGAGQVIRTQLVGDYNLPNVLAAVSVGRHFSVPDEDIVSAIEGYAPSNSRSQMVLKNGNHIILDAYNANPTSMRAAIENIGRQPHDRKIVLIGGMMELGDESVAEHAEIIRLLQGFAWENVILVGGDFEKVKHPYRYFGDSEQAAAWIREHPVSDAWILVKGSRSMQMEKVMASL